MNDERAKKCIERLKELGQFYEGQLMTEENATQRNCLLAKTIAYRNAIQIIREEFNEET
jgi:hypothetical protein